MSSLDDTGISPMNYLKIFFRRKELILIPAFIGLVLGACTGLLMPKKFKSSTVILVQEGKSDNPLFDKLTVSTTVEQRLTGIRESILGWTSLSELVKRLELDKKVSTKLEFEELIKGIKKNIRLSLRGGNILYLDYVSENPEQTQAVVKNITDIFISKNEEAQDLETADAIKFIEAQLHVYKGKIKSAEIAGLQDRLDSLLLDSTAKHPLVKELKDKIDAKRAILKKENLDYTENTDIADQKTKPMIDEIKQALDSLEGQNKGKNTAGKTQDSMLMLNVNLENVLARDVNVNEQIYNMLLQRIETAKITQRLQASKEGTHYKIIDPPRIPLRPFKPNKVLIAFVGLFLGAVSGVGLVLATEFMDKSFIDVEEAKEYLGVALFGAISKINTPESLKRDKEKERWLYGLTFVVGVVMVTVTYQLAHFVK
jgi:uncharacterized protein involved in exopolysaccharide biosynthesis